MKIKLIWEATAGVHRRVRVFAGPDRDHLAFVGDLTLKGGEARAFRSTVRQGISHDGFTGIFESGWTDD